MAAATPTLNCFALRNLDAKGRPVEPTRFRSATAAMYKAIELRTGATAGGKPLAAKGDGQVREVVGIDSNSRLRLLSDLGVVAEAHAAEGDK